MSMKNFQAWTKIKTWLHNEKPRVFIYESEICFCQLGENVGFEQDGRGEDFIRPVIVLRKFNSKIFWAIPLTKTRKEGLYCYPFYFRADLESTAIITQIRLVDAKRLKYKVGRISSADLFQIKEKLKHLLENFYPYK